MEENKPTDPGDVGLLRPNGIVAHANSGADLIEQLRFLRHGVIPPWILAYCNAKRLSSQSVKCKERGLYPSSGVFNAPNFGADL